MDIKLTEREKGKVKKKGGEKCDSANALLRFVKRNDCSGESVVCEKKIDMKP